MNRKELESKLSVVTSHLLCEKGHIAFVDVFKELGVLSSKDIELWRMRKVPYLERVIQMNLSKISFVMKTVRRNSKHGKLKESFTFYKSFGKGKKVKLRFSKSGDVNIERVYATHFLKRNEEDVEQNEK